MIPLDDYLGRSERQIERWHELNRTLQDPQSRSKYVRASIRLDHHPSLETGTPAVVYGNVPNAGLIDNLPQDCVVEVPCLVGRNGLQPVKIGRLPPQLAALMQTTSTCNR